VQVRLLMLLGCDDAPVAGLWFCSAATNPLTSLQETARLQRLGACHSTADGWRLAAGGWLRAVGCGRRNTECGCCCCCCCYG
jgi:hypothetical protein